MMFQLNSKLILRFQHKVQKIYTVITLLVTQFSIKKHYINYVKQIMYLKTEGATYILSSLNGCGWINTELRIQHKYAFTISR